MKREWLIAAGVIVGVIALVALVDVAVSSPSACMSCHEMQHRGTSWERSPHASIRCVTCHVDPHPWYAYPVAFVGRTGLMVQDTVRHVRGGYEDPVDTRAPGTEPMPDEICLQCHSPNRQATSGFRILINHPEHAKRNGSCVSCHIRAAHPLDDRSAAMSLMGQCLTCHGTAEYPEASRQCSTCHPKSYDLRPASHAKPSKWKRVHGKVAISDAKQCVMCHEKSWCAETCHGGLEMPHPDGWEKGAAGHAAVAQTNRSVCAGCHGESQDMCTRCHHSGFQPGKGPWTKQHHVQVEQDGLAPCIDCHASTFCVRCHETLDALS